MESNEKPEDEKHETGFEEKENLELSSAIAPVEHKEDNVIGKLLPANVCFDLLKILLNF